MHILAQKAEESMSNNSRLVYSTESGRIKESHHANAEAATSGDGWVRLMRESKGRGGKCVSLIDGVPSDQQKALCKSLKQKLGCGGAVKSDRIEIQGERRKEIKDLLEQLGYQVKISGS